MIERLIKKIPVTVYENQCDFVKKQKKFIKVVEESFSVIEKNYSVKIPVEEIRCIYDIVTMKQNTSLIQQEL
jgi:sigma-54 dependent transcriptional regulator of gfr operon